MPGVFAHQLLGVAVIAPGALGAPFTGTQRDALVPQLLLAVTHTLLVLNAPNVVLMLVVPCPLVIAPGEVQLYVTPAPCDGQLYATVWLHNPVNAPEILLGWLGKPGATVLHFCAEVTPQVLVTLTHMLPAAL
jgi:hypothetical protein